MKTWRQLKTNNIHCTYVMMPRWGKQFVIQRLQEAKWYVVIWDWHFVGEIHLKQTQWRPSGTSCPSPGHFHNGRQSVPVALLTNTIPFSSTYWRHLLETPTGDCSATTLDVWRHLVFRSFLVFKTLLNVNHENQLYGSHPASWGININNR